jgi:alkylation response protein AidB-like acyl-CoA dehydrogenase
MSVVARLSTEELPDTSWPAVAAWWAAHRRLAAELEDPADLALRAGMASDRPAWAFASGYEAALRSLVPSLPRDAKVALAVTEEGGNHPRAIQTRVERSPTGLRLDGVKSFITLGTHAELILVAATSGIRDDGRPKIEMVKVPASAPGIRLEAHGPAPFVPEVPHARAVLEGVEVPADGRLSGDGYADYVKPFRTVEDAHVALALTGHLIRVARQADAAAEVLAELVALADATHRLCGRKPADPETHVLLAGAFEWLRGAADDSRLWDTVDPSVRAVWERDRAILEVAEKARKARLAAALLALRQ